MASTSFTCQACECFVFPLLYCLVPALVTIQTIQFIYPINSLYTVLIDLDIWLSYQFGVPLIGTAIIVMLCFWFFHSFNSLLHFCHHSTRKYLVGHT